MSDFVTFETAVKLKEKGFPQSPDHFNYNNYYEWDGLRKIHPLYNINIWYDNINKKNLYFAPTISQALKWFREKHASHIEIALGENGWYFEIVQYEYSEEENEYYCKVIDISGDYYKSYEEAALVGIEYVLDNLV